MTSGQTNNDAFERTLRQITKFCFHIHAKGDSPPGTKVSYRFCPFWNCADDGCVADKADHEREELQTPKALNWASGAPVETALVKTGHRSCTVKISGSCHEIPAARRIITKIYGSPIHPNTSETKRRMLYTFLELHRCTIDSWLKNRIAFLTVRMDVLLRRLQIGSGSARGFVMFPVKQVLRAGMFAAFAMAAVSLPSAAQATTFDMTIDTVNQTDGYDITLTGLTTDGTGLATSLLLGTITGFGTDAYLTGTLSLVTPSSAEGTTLQGTAFNFDGLASPNSPYFSFTSSSGIVLADSSGSAYLNPYLGLDNLLYDSISIGGAYPTNPGDLVNILTSPDNIGGAGAAPLPSTISMLLGGFALIGFLAGRKRKATGDFTVAAA